MDFCILIVLKIHFEFWLLPYHDKVEEGSSMMRLSGQNLPKLAGILSLFLMRRSHYLLHGCIKLSCFFFLLLMHQVDNQLQF